VRLREVRERYRPGQVFEFTPLGDFHLGSANCDHHALEKWIGHIADNPDARWVGMGDLVESIAPDDKRWNPSDVDEAVTLHRQARIGDWYVERITEVIRPIADKCWSLNDGNHEDKFGARYFTNLLARVAKELGRPDLYQEWASITRVIFEDDHQHRCTLRIYQQHGWQAGRKDGAKINGLDDLMSFVRGCDIYLVAHSHSRLLKTYTQLGTTPSFKDLKAYDSYGAHTASFLRTYQVNRVGYGEKRGYPPTSIRPIRFHVMPTRDGVELEGIL
jgi:hypothetical protein